LEAVEVDDLCRDDILLTGLECARQARDLRRDRQAACVGVVDKARGAENLGRVEQ
jgi:hypothetical protein